jgi:hypothetical protein
MLACLPSHRDFDPYGRLIDDDRYLRSTITALTAAMEIFTALKGMLLSQVAMRPPWGEGEMLF